MQYLGPVVARKSVGFPHNRFQCRRRFASPRLSLRLEITHPLQEYLGLCSGDRWVARPRSVRLQIPRLEESTMSGVPDSPNSRSPSSNGPKYRTNCAPSSGLLAISGLYPLKIGSSLARLVQLRK